MEQIDMFNFNKSPFKLPKHIRLLELFGGIGACTQALKRLCFEVDVVDYVEIDKYAVKSYNAINGTDFVPQDITKWDKDVGDVDVLMHGSPCQDFSLAGKQLGGDENSGTRSSLLFETIRIVEKVKPRVVVWENVKNVLSKKHIHNFRAYQDKLQSLGYTSFYKVLNAKDFGIPQNRERVFCISILDNDCYYEFPNGFPLEKRLGDVLETEVDEKYYLSKKGVNYIFKRIGKYTQLINKNTKCAKSAITAVGNSNWTGNFVIEPRCVQVGNLSGGKWDKMHDVSRRVYSDGGLSPTVHTCSGGNTELKIITAAAMRGRKNGQQLEVSDREYSNALTTVQKDSLVNKNLIIRKLTPKECWRLMGFSDEDFSKAEKVNSNSQLYKQAGNSIVVDVLYAIFKEMR